MAHTINKTRLYEALGQIVVSFEALEQGIDGLILCSMDSANAQNTLLLDSINFVKKVSNMNELIRELHSDEELGALRDTLDALVERCYTCEQQRNNWVRSYWVPEVEAEDGVVMRLQRSRDAGGLVLVPCQLLELENFIVVLNATVAYVRGFHQKLCISFKRIRNLPVPENYLTSLRLVDKD